MVLIFYRISKLPTPTQNGGRLEIMRNFMLKDGRRTDRFRYALVSVFLQHFGDAYVEFPLAGYRWITDVKICSCTRQRVTQ